MAVIEFRQGDILSAGTEALVNTVNCVGVMGRGIARAFKEAYPENFRAYEQACKRGEVLPGRMFVFETGQVTNPRYIINFPTKRHWRGKSRIEDIQTGLDALVAEISQRGIKSIAVPPLGSGLGTLDWRQVRPLIEKALSGIPDLKATIFEPGGHREEAPVPREAAPPQMTTARAVLVLAMQSYLRAALDPLMSLLELHKLLYFAEYAGEDLQLSYAKGHYGPYARNLRFLLAKMNHYYVEADLSAGDQPTVAIELVPSAIEDAAQFLRDKPETLARIERLSALVEGWESPHGLELLSTVHWLVLREGVTNRDQVIERTYAWNPRKRRFTERQIDLALETLRERGWAPC